MSGALAATPLRGQKLARQTEIGLLPEDWCVVPLGGLCRFENGDRGVNYPSKRDFIRSGIPFVNAGHLQLGRIDHTGLDFISREKFESLGAGKFIPGDILFCLRGSLGKFAVVTESSPEGAIASSLVIVRPVQGQITTGYLAAYFTSELASQMIALWAGGAAQPNLGAQDLGRFLIPLPPTAKEQEAIAEALSDADTLIDHLKRLIAKKQHIKLAAMQELLSGRRRLPGFEENWLKRPIKDVAPLQRGFDLPNSDLKAGPYPVVYSNGIANYHNRFQVRGPGVVTGRSGTMGTITYVENDFWPHNTSLWVTNFNGNHPRFVFYLYTLVDFSRFASGSGVPTLNRNDAHAFIVSIPQSVDEQEAIAALLSEMDQEIDLLEERLTKVRLLKQGMMQELLTGRVRLV